VRNERARIAETLEKIRSATGSEAEILVVDGGSSDGTAEAARGLADRILASPVPGRGAQMHAGAQAASGAVLLFLHADTELPAGWPSLLKKAFLQENEPPAATAFRLSFDSNGFFYRVCAFLANQRAKLTGVPHGDQAIAVSRDAYFAAGGFPSEPLMEEYLLIPRLREIGEVRIFRECIVTSARRYRARGPLRNALRNQTLITLFYLGVSPRTLARWY
jgi:rSAM/selenodomain-associated transferase 2